MRFLFVALAFSFAAPALAQEGAPRQTGPRFGVTYLGPGIVDAINERLGDADDPEPFRTPLTTQFGWQFEVPTFQSDGGITGLVEVVPLIGGLERGVALPTITFIAGARTPRGWELGVGPNIAITGVSFVETASSDNGLAFSLALAGGKSLDIGGANVPVNGAVVVGESGLRLSFLVGLTTAAGRY